MWKSFFPLCFALFPGLCSVHIFKNSFFAYFGTCYGVYLNRLCRVEFHAKIWSCRRKKQHRCRRYLRIFFRIFRLNHFLHPAPPLAIYILYTGWKQQKALGALGSALIIITGTSCVSHYFAGFYTEEFLTYLYIGVPAGILGMLVSFPFIKYITQKNFRKILLVVIGFAGLMCLSRVIGYYCLG